MLNSHHWSHMAIKWIAGNRSLASWTPVWPQTFITQLVPVSTEKKKRKTMDIWRPRTPETWEWADRELVLFCRMLLSQAVPSLARGGLREQRGSCVLFRDLLWGWSKQWSFSHSPHWELVELHTPILVGNDKCVLAYLLWMSSEYESHFHGIPWKWTITLASKINPSIIHMHWVELFYCGRLIANTARVPTISVSHTLCNVALSSSLNVPSQAVWLALANRIQQREPIISFQSLGFKGLCT